MKAASLALGLVFLFASSAFAANETAYCNVEYVSSISNQVKTAPYSRNCAFGLHYQVGGGTTDRYYSCSVPQGGSGCQVTIANAPSWPPASGWTDQPYTELDNYLGCVHANGAPAVDIALPPPNMPTQPATVVVTQGYYCTGL
jgi:hypothetical protein